MDINEFIMSNEMLIRVVFFFGMLGIMALWEIVAPRRALTVSKSVRWINNLGLVFFNSLLLRLLFPAAAVGMAAFANEQGWDSLIIMRSRSGCQLWSRLSPWISSSTCSM